MTERRRDTGSLGVVPEEIVSRAEGLQAQLAHLWGSRVIRFDDGCRSAMPEEQGVYRIFDPTCPDETIRAGRTKTAGGGLRQRVYQNHLMGDQQGNLRQQLVDGKSCADLAAAKTYIREHLAVQVLLVEDENERRCLEYFMLSVLRPRYFD